MSTLAATITVIGATLAIVSLAVGLQTFWINRSLGRVEDALKDVRTELKGEIKETRIEWKGDITKVDVRLDELKTEIVRDHGERIARLEERIVR
ncbi:MAG: hypothetical protein ABSB73_09170 [Solirubrobacteraceae bacterium]|jgi:transposase